jgi:hypothetical protein
MEQENNESSNYVELKATPELSTTSINAIVSTAHKMRRPPSLSESFAWSPVNMTRAAASGTSLNLLIASPSPPQQPSPPPQPRQQSPPPPFSHKFIIYILKFTFHITLISIFESIFFFLYVSTLENNGINVTINYFTNSLVTSCETYTPLERNITNAILDAFVNASTIVAAGDQEQIVRNTENTKLFNRAWYYVGALSFLFICVVLIAVYKKIQLSWWKLICENFGLVIMLAAYEYMFFSTIIFPYAPLSGAEIARNIVFMLQYRCGLLV